MAIIYSYPEKTTPAGGDFLVITDSEQTAPNKNRTKSLTIDNLASYVITSTGAITGSGTLNTIAMFTPDGQKVGDSKITQSYDFINYTVSIDAELEIGGAYPTGTSIFAGSIFTSLIGVNNITAGDTGTVSLLGNTVIGNAGTDTLTVNAETTFDTNVNVTGLAGSPVLTIGHTNAITFIDSLGTVDLRISRDLSNNSIIQDSSPGDLILISDTELEIKSGILGENFAKFTKDGPIELYYDNQKRLSTTNTGINVPLSVGPSSSTDTGTSGDIIITAAYIYVCIATNTWRRSALTTF